MSNFVISNNAYHIGQIGELRALMARLAHLEFNKLTYEELRDEIKINCQLLQCNYVLDGQNTQGYTNLMDCEDSDLLTDIAHGLNKFVHSNFKFSVRRKAELHEVFNDYWKKLDDLCNATLRELDSKTSRVRFSLPVITALNTKRVSMVNESKDLLNASNMSYFYADLKQAMESDKLIKTMEMLDFETVFTEKIYYRISDKEGTTEFKLNHDRLLRVRVSSGHSQAKYFVTFGLYDKIGSHLVTERATLKKDAFMCDDMTEIVKHLRAFAGLQLADSQNYDQGVHFVGVDNGRQAGLYGDSFDQRQIYMVKDGADPVFVCNHHTNTGANRHNKSNTEQIQRYTNQLIETNGAFFCLHSALSSDPFEYLQQMRKHNATFEAFLFSAELCKKSGYYQIAGNLKELSAVFRFRFYDETLFRLWLQMASKIDPAMQEQCKYDYSKPLTVEEEARAARFLSTSFECKDIKAGFDQRVNALVSNYTFARVRCGETVTVTFNFDSGFSLVATVTPGNTDPFSVVYAMHSNNGDVIYSKSVGCDDECNFQDQLIEFYDQYTRRPLMNPVKANALIAGVAAC